MFAASNISAVAKLSEKAATVTIGAQPLVLIPGSITRVLDNSIKYPSFRGIVAIHFEPWPLPPKITLAYAAVLVA
jgi:hypothetical protein